MGKHITVIGINFYPEDTAIGLYSTQMAEFLKQNGFEISVITGFPYYPQWEIWKEYKDKPHYLVEHFQGIKIYRYKQFTPKKPDFKSRIKHILDFSIGNLKNINKIESCNLVIAVVPFLMDVWLAYKLAKRTKAKIWVHVQDFEIDAALEAGIIDNKFLKKAISSLLYKIETHLLNKANIVSTISFSMLEKLKRKTRKDAFYFPNWIDVDFINPEKFNVHPYMKSKKFKILYSGNIGGKQDWELFVNVVKNLKDNKEIEFIVVGDGAKKDWLLEQIRGLAHVKYYPPVPYKELPDLLCSADLHILFQKQDVIDSVMPSKILGMMASGKPSLVTGNEQSEVAKVFKESTGGLFIPRAVVESVKKAILELMNNKDLSHEMGENARRYVADNYSGKKVLKKFLRKVNELLKEDTWLKSAR